MDEVKNLAEEIGKNKIMMEVLHVLGGGYSPFLTIEQAKNLAEKLGGK